MTDLTTNTRVAPSTMPVTVSSDAAESSAITHETTLGGVLWDMDGTLIDSEPLWMAAETSMLDQYGLTMSEEDRDRLIGSGLWDAAEMFQAIGIPLSADEIVEQWVSHVLSGLRGSDIVWRPGARELLASLKAVGVPCALVTMSMSVMTEVVVSLLPEGTFSAIVAGDHVVHAKPHPEPYHRGAEALGIPIERCLAFEDSPPGLRSAFDSGAVAIGVPNLLELDPLSAHAIWPTLAGTDADSLAARFGELRHA